MPDPNCPTCEGTGKFTSCMDFEYDCPCVVKEHKEPREFWLYRDHGEDWVVNEKGKPYFTWDEVIHVREVTTDD